MQVLRGTRDHREGMVRRECSLRVSGDSLVMGLESEPGQLVFISRTRSCEERRDI